MELMCVDLIVKRKEILGLTNQAKPKLIDTDKKDAESYEGIDEYKEKTVSYYYSI